MTISKPVKILLGLATLSPFVFVVALFGSFFFIISNAPKQPREFEEFFSIYGAIFNLVCFLFTAVFSALWVFFIVHAARNPNLDTMRTTWLVVLIVLGGWAMPFYWFHYIWRDGKTEPRTGGPLGLS